MATKKREVLRVKEYGRRAVEERRRASISPPFDLYYQQGVEAKTLLAIKPIHFSSYEPAEVEALRHFISVDPGMSDGEGCSYRVAQVWASNGIYFFLVDQFRRRCRFNELTMNVRTFAKRYRGAPILIEGTATGPALFSALTLKQQRRAVSVRPVDSKVVRFVRHVDKIVGGKIRISKCSPFTVCLWTNSFYFRMALTTTKSTP